MICDELKLAIVIGRLLASCSNKRKTQWFDLSTGHRVHSGNPLSVGAWLVAMDAAVAVEEVVWEERSKMVALETPVLRHPGSHFLLVACDVGFT